MIVMSVLYGLALGDALGWPLADVGVRLIDARGAEADEGELWMLTPANMLGYLNLPEKTRQVLTEDGWYRTKDLVRMDENGYVSITARAKDIEELQN